MLKVNFYKNKKQGHKNYGKIYVRAENAKPIGIDELAEHMAEHDTPFSSGTIKGILNDAAKCIRELALLGQPVKLDNLAIFKVAITSRPQNDLESVNLANPGSETSSVKAVRLLCQTTGRTARAEMTDDAFLGYSSLAKRIKAGELVLSDVKGEYVIVPEEEEPTVNP